MESHECGCAIPDMACDSRRAQAHDADRAHNFASMELTVDVSTFQDMERQCRGGAPHEASSVENRAAMGSYETLDTIPDVVGQCQ